METPLKIYIAGKVSGEEQSDCVAKFAKAQKEIEAQGLIALNPLELVGDWSASWIYAMKLCIIHLMTADAVLFLDDFADSRGAMIEHRLACDLHIPRLRGSRYLVERLEKQFGFVIEKE